MSSSVPDPGACLGYCPFLHLHPNIELAILEQLKFRDYVNLAFTCQKWFYIASRAPNSVKPNLSFERICLSSSGIRDMPSIVGGGKAIFHVPYTKFTHLALVNKIDAEFLTIERQKSDEESMVCQAMQLLAMHRYRFRVETVFIEMPLPFTKGTPHVDALLDMSRHFYLTNIIKQNNQRERFRWFFKEHLFSQKHLSFDHCDNGFPIDLDLVNSFLKQCVRGERPNLLTFISEVYNRKDSWSLITAGLEHLEDIEEKTTIFNEKAICAKLVIADSKFVLYHRPKYVFLRKEGHLCDNCDVDEDEFI